MDTERSTDAPVAPVVPPATTPLVAPAPTFGPPTTVPIPLLPDQVPRIAPAHPDVPVVPGSGPGAHLLPPPSPESLRPDVPPPVRQGAATIEQTTQSGRTRRSTMRTVIERFLLLVLVAGLGVAAYLGYQEFVGDAGDSSTSDGVIERTPVDGEPTTGIGRIIDDAETVTDQIKDNASEDEALDMLDIAPDARVFPATAIETGVISVADAQSYSFTWTRATGTATVLVDATTGDVQIDDRNADGAHTTVRRVDGQVYETSTGADGTGGDGDGWSQTTTADLSAETYFGIDRLVTTSMLRPVDLGEFTVSTDLDEFGYGALVVDDLALLRAAPLLRADLLRTWGVANAAIVNEGDQITIVVRGGVDDVVTYGSIAVSATGSSATFELLDASPDRRPFVAPQLG